MLVSICKFIVSIVTYIQAKTIPFTRHVDFDCFFASVGIRDRPHLKDKPVAVSHSKGFCGDSSSDIGMTPTIPFCIYSFFLILFHHCSFL